MWITWHNPLVLLTSALFFTGNQQILLYQEIDIDSIQTNTSNTSNFSWVFKDCFNKRGQNFDDISTRYKLEILQQCGKKVKTKSQEVLGANSYVCRSYRGKTGRGPFCPPPLPPPPSSIELRKRNMHLSRGI